MASLLGVVVLVLIVLVIVGLFRRRSGSARVSFATLGVLLDRAVRAYRRDLLPLLGLSLLSIPLRIDSGASPLLLLAFDPGIMAGSPLALVTWVGTLLNATGVGWTLLACAVVTAQRLRNQGQPVSLGAVLRQMRWSAALGLAALLIVPSLICTVVGLLGALVTLVWSLAPVVLVYEELGPLAALRRGTTLGRRYLGMLLNVTVPLWLIGWLIVGAPLFGAAFLLEALHVLPPTALSSSVLVIPLVSSVFVAPLLALGALQVYQQIGEQEALPLPLPVVPSAEIS